MNSKKSSASSRRERPTGKNDASTPKLVRKSYPENRKPTAAEVRMLNRLAAMPDSSIDYSDIPPLDDSRPRQIIRNRFNRANQFSLRVEPDLFDWLQSLGPRAEKTLNRALRTIKHAEQRQRHV